MEEANKAAAEILAGERLAEHQARGRRALRMREAQDLGADVSDQALVDAFAGGMSHEAIARTTGMTEAMVRSRLRRAHHRRLKPSWLQPEPEEEDEMTVDEEYEEEEVIEDVEEDIEPPSLTPPTPPQESSDDVMVGEEEEEEEIEEDREQSEPETLQADEVIDPEEDVDEPRWGWQTIGKLARCDGAPSIATLKKRADSKEDAWSHYETRPVSEVPGNWHPRATAVYRLANGTDFGANGEKPRTSGRKKKTAKTRKAPSSSTSSSAWPFSKIERQEEDQAKLLAKIKDLESSLEDARVYCDEFDTIKEERLIFKKAIDIMTGASSIKETAQPLSKRALDVRALVKEMRIEEKRRRPTLTHAERFEQLLSSMGEEGVIKEVEAEWTAWFQERKARSGATNEQIGWCFGCGEHTSRTLAAGGEPPLEHADFARLARVLCVDPAILLAKHIVKRMDLGATVELVRAAAATLDKERSDPRRGSREGEDQR